MTVLITGGTGFIGAELARSLLVDRDAKVVVFDINPSTRRLSDVADRIEFVRGDLGTFGHVLRTVRSARPDVIYHLGGMLSFLSEDDPPGAISTNVLGTYHILEAAKLFGVRQVIFASTTGTYSSDIREPVIDDYTLQRPHLLYGVTKVFGEHLGRFYKRQYGLDFRGLRLPSIVGPRVRTPGVAKYTSWVIEECANGKPFTIKARPETAVPVLYFKDAVRAMLQLGAAPLDAIRMVVYLATLRPTPTAQELADAVRARIPGAVIGFEPDAQTQPILDGMSLPLDDRLARQEWNWSPAYNQEQIVDDYLRELRLNPERYS